jgi:competence protein ComEA
MTYTIPGNTEPAVFESYLRILVSARDAPLDEKPDAGVQAVIQGALAFRKSVWLGIGDAANLVTDFEIRGVAGWLSDTNEKAIRVLITNTGSTPIRPTGSVQLADPLFANNTFGPFEFQTNSINPGESAYGDVIVDSAINDGRWSIFVQATQGSIRKTAKFDQDIRFDRSLDEFGSSLKWATRFGIGALGVGLILVGYVLMRGKRRKRDGDPPSDDPPSPKTDPSPIPTPTPHGTNVVVVDAATEHQAEQLSAIAVSPNNPTPQNNNRRIVVQVSGAVRNPGLFEVDDDTRVGEVIELAGGANILAETTEINFARRVVDGEQIFLPKRVVASRELKPFSTPAVLDLNHANGKQLAEIPGVGQDLGAAIVAHRRRIGKFTSVEQLLEVKGIGPRKLALIKKHVRV